MRSQEIKRQGDQRKVPSWNPLTVSGTTMPPNLLLAAKLLTLCFLLTGRVATLPDHFLPFIPLFEDLGSPLAFQRGLQLAFCGAALLLFVNRHVRTACGTAGTVILVGILSSQQYYHNNRLFTGLFLLLAGLYDPRAGTSILRYQLVVLYFGAGLNRALDVDWRSGAFVQDWLPHYLAAYSRIASILPDALLSMLLGWTAIVTECSLAALLLIRRLVPLGIFVGVAYHTGLVLLTVGQTFGFFWYALMASYLALLNWPSAEIGVRYSPAKLTHRAANAVFERIDLERRFKWLPGERAPLEVELPNATYSGSAALARVLLYSPVAYFAFALLVTVPPRAHAAIPLIFVLLAVIAYGFVSQLRGSPRTPVLRVRS